MSNPDDRPFPHVALAERAHDRLGLRRTDEAWLDEQWADPATRVLIVAGTRVRPGDDGAPEWHGPGDWTGSTAPEGIRVLLGERGGRAHLAVIVDPDSVADPEEWVPLRDLLPLLAADPATSDPGGPVDAPLLFHAVGLAEWHHATRFCPRCAARLHSRAAGHELVCAACGRRQFPRTDPAVIMAISHGEPGSAEEALLLGRQVRWPEGRWSTLAGFLEPGETLEDAVRREVAEEVGVTVGEVSWFGNQPWPLPASLMLGFHGRATSTAIEVDGAEIAEAAWFTRAQLREALGSGAVQVPRSVSISASLIEDWYGEPLPGGW